MNPEDGRHGRGGRIFGTGNHGAQRSPATRADLHLAELDVGGTCLAGCSGGRGVADDSSATANDAMAKNARNWWGRFTKLDILFAQSPVSHRAAADEPDFIFNDNLAKILTRHSVGIHFA